MTNECQPGPACHPRDAALDGVFDRQDDYAKSGFVFAHRNLRMRFAASATRSLCGEGQPQSFDRAHLDALIRYDRRCFPVGREPFLGKWLTPIIYILRLICADKALSCALFPQSRRK